MSFRVAVFTASLAPHVVRTVRKLLDEQPDAGILILHHSPRKPLKRVLRNQWRNLRRHGWRWVPYQTAEIGSLLASRLRTKHADRPSPRDSVAGLAGHARVELQHVPSINAAETVEMLRAWQPDLGLSLAAPILKPALFETPRLGTLNIHKGRLPHYRGMPPAFWEIWNGEQEVGVTVHKVEAGLDTGPILLEGGVPIDRFATADGVRVRLDELGVKLIVEAVARMRAGTAEFRAQPAGGRTFTRPTLAQEAALRRRVSPPDPVRTTKNLVFQSYAALSHLAPARRDRVVILLYHRVSDAFRDSVTVGVDQFDAQMRFLADHHRLVRLEDIVDRPPTGEGPFVAVTFDDGYLDNYENAAPVLLRHGVPATFFVSTAKVAHNLPFDHDLTKLGHSLPNMNWDQIREMQAEGLAFGSHTANHVNLAKVDAETAMAELVESRQTLERELGLSRVMFAYPYGKRADCTPERLEQIKRAGFICNCSAYGGVNERTVDRWDIRRQGIDHSFDVAALKAKIAGWKARSYV